MRHIGHDLDAFVTGGGDAPRGFREAEFEVCVAAECQFHCLILRSGTPLAKAEETRSQLLDYRTVSRGSQQLPSAAARTLLAALLSIDSVVAANMPSNGDPDRCGKVSLSRFTPAR